MGKKIFALLLALVLLSGCHQKQKTEGWRVVTHITVTCEDNCTLTRRTYFREEKMRPILNALRQLGQRFTPDRDPETLIARTWCITLTHSDGSQRFYRIKGDRYIQENRERWQQTDPQKIMDLDLLFQQMASDDPADGLRREIPRRRPLPLWAKAFDISPEICYYMSRNSKGRTLCPTSSRSPTFLPRSWMSTPG